MKQYRIEFTPRAVGDFRALPKGVQRRLTPLIDALGKHPRTAGAKKLTGADNLYRIRSGDYRILYQIKDMVCVVLVIRLGNRKDVYRRL